MVQRKKGEQRSRRGAVIFDFDGTIADSFDYVFDFLYREAGGSRVYTPDERTKLRQMSMKRLALHLGIAPWRLPYIYFKGRRIMRAHMEHVQPFAGMPAVIKELFEAGYDLFVVSSNSAHNIRRLLRQQSLDHMFTGVRGGAGYTGKRSLIRQLMVRYRLNKGATIYVGDEASDVVASTAAGLRCIAVAWGFADPEKLRLLQPFAIAETPDDILRILGDMWKQ